MKINLISYFKKKMWANANKEAVNITFALKNAKRDNPGVANYFEHQDGPWKLIEI
jgi:hypothetical protein